MDLKLFYSGKAQTWFCVHSYGCCADSDEMDGYVAMCVY